MANFPSPGTWFQRALRLPFYRCPVRGLLRTVSLAQSNVFDDSELFCTRFRSFRLQNRLIRQIIAHPEPVAFLPSSPAKLFWVPYLTIEPELPPRTPVWHESTGIWQRNIDRIDRDRTRVRQRVADIRYAFRDAVDHGHRENARCCSGDPAKENLKWTIAGSRRPPAPRQRRPGERSMPNISPPGAGASSPRICPDGPDKSHPSCRAARLTPDRQAAIIPSPGTDDPPPKRFSPADISQVYLGEIPSVNRLRALIYQRYINRMMQF